MATAYASHRDDHFLSTIGDLAVGESGFVAPNALWATDARALFLNTDAPVMTDEGPWANLFVIRTAAGFLVDATHVDSGATVPRCTPLPPRVPVIAIMHGDKLLR